MIKKKTIQTKLDDFSDKGVYKPKLITQEDMQEGLRVGLKRSHEKPSFDRPVDKSFFGKGKQQLESTEKVSEQHPYWSASEWENWALKLYRDIPEARQYLPKWVIEDVEGK